LAAAELQEEAFLFREAQVDVVSVRD